MVPQRRLGCTSDGSICAAIWTRSPSRNSRLSARSPARRCACFTLISSTIPSPAPQSSPSPLASVKERSCGGTPTQHPPPATGHPRRQRAASARLFYLSRAYNATDITTERSEAPITSTSTSGVGTQVARTATASLLHRRLAGSGMQSQQQSGRKRCR